MDEINPVSETDGSKNCSSRNSPNESSINETLYTSAFADQTWLQREENDSKIDEEKSLTFENFCSMKFLLQLLNVCFKKRMSFQS